MFVLRVFLFCKFCEINNEKKKKEQEKNRKKKKTNLEGDVELIRERRRYKKGWKLFGATLRTGDRLEN